MRIDSCRKCGNQMKTKQKCSICTEPIKFQCKECHFVTDEQIHLNCKSVSEDYQLLPARVA